MANEKYCSTRFTCGEDLDAALDAALRADDNATRAEHAAARAEAAARGYVSVEVANHLPSPGKSQRGKLLISPDGDTDVLYICMLIGGVYKWAEFVTQVSAPTGVTYLVDRYGTKLKTADGVYLAVHK